MCKFVEVRHGEQAPVLMLTNQRPGMKSGVGSTQTKNFGHYIHFAGNVLLWGKSVVRIEIHFFKSKCFQGSYSSQDADVPHLYAYIRSLWEPYYEVRGLNIRAA